jgi:hypothetical protein
MLRVLRVARQTALKGPHPGHQRAAGAAGHRPARAARAAPGTVEDRPAPRGRRP